MTMLQDVQSGSIPARLTVADVYALQAAGVIDEREHFELVGGEIVPMAAAKSSPHERMKSQLIRALASVRGEARLFVEPTVALQVDDFAEPDLAIWDRRHQSEDVRGVDLLLVIEVAVSSLPYDLREKAGRYATAQVRDYWVVDAVRRTVRVHRDPVDGVYRSVREFGSGDRIEPLSIADIPIRLDDLD